MSYLVLARKYRPQTFEEVYAQDQITQILKNSIEMDRIAHAYLFCGPRGVGKTSLARIFAKSLNCLENDESLRPCNKCDNCVEITQGTSQDVIEIDGASNTGVEDIRELQKELLYTTNKSRFKIYIIDEVHMLSKNAFNALLKTLEEPPDQVIFIFATTEPHKVLPTIISRCQRFDFKRIPIKKIVARLNDICQKEEINISEESLFYIAKLADGSMRDSQSLLDQVLAYGKEKLELCDILEIFGTVATEVYQQIMESIREKKPAEIINLLHQILAKGTDLQEFLNGMLEYIRNLTLLKVGVEPQEIAPGERESMAKTADLFEEDELIYLISLLVRTKTDVKSSNTPVLLAEMAFIKLAQIARMSSLEDILTGLKSGSISAGRAQPSVSQISSQPKQVRSSSLSPLEEARQQQKQHEEMLHKKLETEKKKEEELSQKAKELFSDLDLEKISKYLPSLAESIQREKMLIGKDLARAKLLGYNNGKLKVEITKNISFSMMTSNIEWLEQKFSQFFGSKIKLDFVLNAPKRKRAMINPSIYDIEKKSPKLAEKLKRIDENMQITSLINNEY